MSAPSPESLCHRRGGGRDDDVDPDGGRCDAHRDAQRPRARRVNALALTALSTLLLAAPPEAARIDLRRAAAALDAGDPAQAAAWYREAIGLDPTPQARLGLAVALAAQASTCAEAEAAFGAAVVDCGALCGEVEAARAAAAERCSAALTVETVPRRARLALDGAWWEPTPVWAGTRTITATWPGGATRAQTVCLAPGVAAKVRVERDGRRAVDPTVPVDKRALAHQEAAFAHVEAGASCEAAAEFRAAHAARPDPAFIYNEAMANALDPGRCAAAIEAFDRFVAACPDCPQVWAARDRRRELLPGCQGVLAVRLPVPDAAVWVDGELSPARSERLPGTYRVTVQAPGHHPVTVPAPVATGETRTVEPALMPIVAPPTPPPPALGAAALPALPPEPPDPPAPDRTWVIVAAGIGVAGLVAGGAFTALAIDDRDTFIATEAEARRDPTQSYRDPLRGHLDAFVFDRAMAVTGWTVGGAGLAAAALLWWLDVPAPVQASPGGVGLGMEF